MEYAALLTGKIVCGFLAVILYYGLGKRQIFKAAFPLGCALRLTARYSTSEATAVVELALAGGTHLLFCALTMWLFGISWANTGLLNVDPLQCVYGFLLGAGLLAVSSLLCRVAISLFQALWPAAGPGDLRNWLALSRAGWLRHHLRTIEVVPLPLALSLIAVQVSAEEFFFRGVLMQYYLPCGKAVALVFPLALFTLMQVFNMPSLQSAMFPVVGAVVMGLVHGLLYLGSPSLLPLVISHLTFFGLAVL
jgi:membrane protease YdiL (CAAX protease family)